MDLWRIAIAAALVVVIGWLLHFTNVIGSNPRLRIKIHEDLAGAKLPDNLSIEEKQDRLDWFGGISRRSAKQTALYVALMVIGVCVLFLVRG